MRSSSSYFFSPKAKNFLSRSYFTYFWDLIMRPCITDDIEGLALVSPSCDYFDLSANSRELFPVSALLVFNYAYFGEVSVLLVFNYTYLGESSTHSSELSYVTFCYFLSPKDKNEGFLVTLSSFYLRTVACLSCCSLTRYEYLLL